jgi:hypothetical protein
MGLHQLFQQLIWPGAEPVPAIFRRPTSHKEWTLSQERIFMEELVYKRLTLFLTISGALITGVISLREEPLVALALSSIGTILCWVLQQTVHRAQLKLDIILQILFADDTHPTGRVNNIYNDSNRVRLVGVAIPSLLCLVLTFLTAGEVGVMAGWIVVPPSEQSWTGPDKRWGGEYTPETQDGSEARLQLVST